jgi:hypothetical protein
LISTLHRLRKNNHLRRLLLASLGVMLFAVAGLVGGAFWASRRAPAFYREALAASPEEAIEHGERFERAALALHNQTQHAGRWETSLSADEINGWLATELPAKFPQLLPAGISEPRVAIDGDLFHIAVRYSRGNVDTVLSLSGEAYLTAQTNEVAIRLESARAGLVPIPLGRVIQEVDSRAEHNNVSLRWTEVKGLPVALIRLPLDGDDDQNRVVLDRLSTANNQLLLAGRTEMAATTEDKQPSTAGQGDKATRQR